MRLAEICVETLRGSDIFARLGGEEFAAILPGSDLDGARVLAERLRAAIAGLVVPFQGRSIQISASIGLSTMETQDEGLDALLSRADQALYRAKQAGRNRVVC